MIGTRSPFFITLVLGLVGLGADVPSRAEQAKAARDEPGGTIHDLTSSDPERAQEGHVSIDVQGSVIRDAGFVDGFRGEAQNIWLAPSVLAKGPFARGRYRLAVRDSTVEKAVKGGIAVGNAGSDFKIGPDKSLSHKGNNRGVTGVEMV